MDELIGLAIDALRAKNAQGGQTGAAAARESPAERYQRVLDDLRARTAGREGPSTTPQAPPVAPRAAPAPKAVVTPKPSPPAAVAPSQAYRGPLQGLFEGGNSLVRAVVAAELLDRPLALRENAHWQKR